MRVFLVGFMGAGKTTLGRKLARKFELKFIDLDREIEKRYQKSIVNLFIEYGEEKFRQIESEILDIFLQSDNYILATGGGTPCFNNIMDKLNRYGTTLYIKIPPEILVKRLLNAYIERPLLKSKTPEEMIEYVYTTLNEREPVYLKAHIILEGEHEPNLDELAKLLLYY